MPLRPPSERSTPAAMTAGAVFAGIRSGTMHGPTDSTSQIGKSAQAGGGDRPGPHEAGAGEPEGGLSPEEVRQLLYELRVNQIELEMQNEELRRAQLETGGLAGALLRPVRSGAGGIFHVSREGVDSRDEPHGQRLLGVAERRLWSTGT